MIPSTLHPAQLQLPLYGTGRRARSAQTAQKKNDTNMLHSSFPVFRCLLLCAVCCVLLCVWSFLIRRGAVGGDTKGMRGHREKTRNITRENLCYLPANHVTGNYRYQVSHIPAFQTFDLRENFRNKTNYLLNRFWSCRARLTLLNRNFL